MADTPPKPPTFRERIVNPRPLIIVTASWAIGLIIMLIITGGHVGETMMSLPMIVLTFAWAVCAPLSLHPTEKETRHAHRMSGDGVQN